MLCSVNLSGFPLPKFFIAPFAISAVILASLFLAACGGGDPVATQVPTSVPATPAPPATDQPVAATAVPSPTAPPAATGSPMSGAATAESPTSVPAVPPTAAARVAPSPAPAEILASNAVRVLRRSCVEEFRQMLVLYDGPEEFGPEVVRRLSDEFTGLRPDCLAEGWDPEFPTDPEVCLYAGHLADGNHYKKDPRSRLDWLRPTMRRESEWPSREGRVTSVSLQVHFTRVPLLSMAPPVMTPVVAGETVGGCWSYSGPLEGGGKWMQSLIKYRGEVHPDVGVMDRDWVRTSLNKFLPNSYPECDSLLQTVISTQLDAGEVPDASAVMDLVEEVRTQAGGGCDREKPWSWMYVSTPMDGGAGGCPGTPLTGSQENGSYVLNWGEHHFDGYGNSACWIRSSEGDWVGYLRPKE